MSTVVQPDHLAKMREYGASWEEIAAHIDQCHKERVAASTVPGAPSYWIAAGGAIIDGPVTLRDVAARYAVGHYPKGAMIKDGDLDWQPLTPAALRSPARSEPEPAAVPAAPVPVARDQMTGGEVADILGAILIALGIVAIIAVLMMDVSAKPPVTAGSDPIPIANLHAMHRQSLYLMTSIAGLLTGILIVTRRR